MPRLIRKPLCEVRSRVFDSARWIGYRPRSDDIIIATYPKCGTTWMQRIVGMLIFGNADPMSLADISPWPDMRVRGPIEEVLAKAEAQRHRRFFKTHLPFDALPVYEGVKFIHVVRDGRDAAISFHNHQVSYSPAAIERYNAVSINDAKFGTPFLPVTQDPTQYFHDWVLDGGGQGDDRASFFHVENSYWVARHNDNMLLVHYNDLKADRASEMRRIAAFLDIEIAEASWPELIAGASFEAMKAHGDELMPSAGQAWVGGAKQFFHTGTNGRWQEVAAKDDLALYVAKVNAQFSPALASWVEHGRLVAGDPQTATD